MASDLVLEATQLLLQAMQRTAGEDGQFSNFKFGPPDKPWQRNLATTVFFSRKRMIVAALFVRRNGPPHLRSMSINDVGSLLTKFVTENYWFLSEETLFQQFPGSYATYVSSSLKERFADRLESSSVFAPPHSIFIFPLIPVLVASNFSSEVFFLTSSGSLAEYLPPQRTNWIAPDLFPPTKHWDGNYSSPSSWLGVHAPYRRVAKKISSAVLGAIALMPKAHYRYQFSMRKMFGGNCRVVGDHLDIQLHEEPNTPALSEDVTLDADDFAWLHTLARKIAATDVEARREIIALEYFYKAWSLDEPERFTWLCMALDALFSERGKATRLGVEGVRRNLGQHICEQRLRALFATRGTVIHGRSPNVFECDEYDNYYSQYQESPVFDLGVIVAECLRAKVFGNALLERPDPNAKLIADMQAMGRLPSKFGDRSILGEG